MPTGQLPADSSLGLNDKSPELVPGLYAVSANVAQKLCDVVFAMTSASLVSQYSRLRDRCHRLATNIGR